MGAEQTRLRGTLVTFDRVPDPGNAGVGNVDIFSPGTLEGGIFL